MVVIEGIYSCCNRSLASRWRGMLPMHPIVSNFSKPVQLMWYWWISAFRTWMEWTFAAWSKELPWYYDTCIEHIQPEYLCAKDDGERGQADICWRMQAVAWDHRSHTGGEEWKNIFKFRSRSVASLGTRAAKCCAAIDKKRKKYCNI